MIEEVHPDEGKVRVRSGWLFGKLDDGAVSAQPDYTEVLRMFNLCEQDLAVGPFVLEVGDDVGHPVLDEVVAEVHQHIVTVDERQCGFQRMSQAERLVLDDVFDPKPEL